jgi:hypothetical protein
MQIPTAHDSPRLFFQSARQSPALGLAALPSFARALRQRGLINPPVAGGDDAANAHGWISVTAIFEAHLRRQAMEQAFAALRGDAE